jgi:hypothetical protein
VTLAIGTTRRAATTAICRRPTSGYRITRFALSRQPDDICDRDSEQVQGIASADYWVPATGAGDPGLPLGVIGLLQRFCLPTV